MPHAVRLCPSRREDAVTAPDGPTVHGGQNVTESTWHRKETARPTTEGGRTVPIYALGDLEPEIAPEAFVHPDAIVIGQVRIGPESTVWPTTVLRGDHGRIVIGARTSIQDGAVVHCTAELDTVIGSDCTIGHLAHLEGCTVEDRALVGSGSTVLHRAIVGAGALVAAQALVAPGTYVPPGALARGVPARIVEDAADAELIDHAVRTYVRNAHWYAAELRRLD